MAGFGAGFTRSFEQTRDQQAQKESDMFKLKYADYISQRDKREQLKREDAKNVKLAKSIVGLMPDQPQEAWTYAADLLRNGMSQEQVMKQFRENQAIVAPKANEQVGTAGNNPADPREDLTQSASNSVNAQMTASGMQKPQGDGIFGNIQQILKGPDMEAKVNRRIAETAGISEQELNNTLTDTNYNPEPLAGSDDYQITWKPKGEPVDIGKITSLGEAMGYKNKIDMNPNSTPEERQQAENIYNNFLNQKHDEIKATGEANGTNPGPSRAVMKDANGKPTRNFAYRRIDGLGNESWQDGEGRPVDPAQIIPYNRAMEEQIDKSGPTISKLTEEYNTGVSNLQQMARTSTEMVALATQMPEATSISGDIAQRVDTIVRGVKGIGTIVTGQDLFAKYGGKLRPEDAVSWKKELGINISKLDAAEREVDTLLQRTGDTALVATLMDIKATKLAYMYAATQGQTGRGVNQEEFNNFKAAAIAGGNPKAIKAAANSFIRDQYKTLKDKEAQINLDSESIVRFESEFGGMPFPYQPATRIDDILSRDADLKGKIDAALADETEKNVKKGADKIEVPSWLPKDISPTRWDALSPRGKELLEKKYKGG